MIAYQDLTHAQQEAILDWEHKNNNDDQFDCCDNHRYAVVGDREQEEAYDGLRMNGCCGFVDVELECSDGTTLLYGFNYGH